MATRSLRRARSGTIPAPYVSPVRRRFKLATDANTPHMAHGSHDERETIMGTREKVYREGTEQQAKGTARELEGRARKTVADAVDDESEQAKGAVKEAAGKVQKNVGKAMRDSAD